MKFKNEDDAWEYWQDWYEYSGKYESPGQDCDTQVEMFKEWLTEQEIES